MRDLLDRYHTSMTQLGNQMMQVLSLGLGLKEPYIKEQVILHDPVVLPHMFRYFPIESKRSVPRVFFDGIYTSKNWDDPCRLRILHAPNTKTKSPVSRLPNAFKAIKTAEVRVLVR
jgi:isopenicillin N synthase-like dioxygenase